jgi:predicted transcriptional regulator
MTQIAIPEELAAELETVARQEDRPFQAIVDEALGSYLVERHLDLLHKQGDILPATQIPRDEVVSLLQRRMEQSRNGDVITSEEVEVWFTDLFKELEAR